MILRDWIRQSHGWLGIMLPLSILANFIAMAFGPPPPIIVYAPIAPLVLVLFSGLYMFFLPQRRKKLSGRDGCPIA
jgi:hypothetical protein